MIQLQVAKVDLVALRGFHRALVAVGLKIFLIPFLEGHLLEDDHREHQLEKICVMIYRFR